MKRLSYLFILLFAATFVFAQNANKAKQILDKTAAVISNKNGISANFSITGKNINTSGTIAVKGGKFNARTPQAIVWNDGKTQWTYIKSSGEVNISTPTEAQQQSMNPYMFVNIYKNGFNLSMKNATEGWQIHLYAANQKRSIKEMYITIDKNYRPRAVRMRQSNGWVTINISNFKTRKLNNNIFRFNANEYPHAEVIDLR